MIYTSSWSIAKLLPHFQRSTVPRKYLFVPESHKSQNISNCLCQCAADLLLTWAMLCSTLQAELQQQWIYIAHAKLYRIKKINTFRSLLTIITLQHWYNYKFIFIVYLKHYLLIPMILLKHARKYSSFKIKCFLSLSPVHFGLICLNSLSSKRPELLEMFVLLLRNEANSTHGSRLASSPIRCSPV